MPDGRPIPPCETQNLQSYELIQRLHQHRIWVNHQLFSAARSLSDEQLRRPFAIGQGSIWKTLTHLMAAEYVWLEALLGNETAIMRGDVRGKLPGNQEAEDSIRSLVELTELWKQLDVRWNDYLSSLDEDALTETVYRLSSSSSRPMRLAITRADVLLHVCTHAQYTTAQLLNMLRQLDVSPLPQVMLMAFARAEAVARASEQ